MILRILFTAFTLAVVHASGFEWPASIENYTEYPNSVCVDENGVQPSYAQTLFLNEGPTKCAEFCSETKGCSGFVFSNVLKDVCILYLLDDSSVADLDSNFFWWTEQGGRSLSEDIHAVTGETCTDLNTAPFCLSNFQFRCYIQVTQQPSVAPSNNPTVSPSTIPSSSPTVLPSLSPSCSPSVVPSYNPSTLPSVGPSEVPSVGPTTLPTVGPTTSPSTDPSTSPSVGPTVCNHLFCFVFLVGNSSSEISSFLLNHQKLNFLQKKKQLYPLFSPQQHIKALSFLFAKNWKPCCFLLELF